jgi:hypothetical protein
LSSQHIKLFLVLYRLKQPEEEIEEPPELASNLNSALLYDLLLGYGPPGVGGELSVIGSEVVGQSEDGSDNNEVEKKSPTLTMTTCYSPVSSSVQSGGRNGNDTSAGTSSSSFFDSKYFPSYSVILAITIAVGE